ncbi:site-specific integrase [Melghirimyces algeriensis]|uniref:Phage integrase family protein n=1 Tax=Melghirimyces algeriensis TaxID=910412 RepID=A0A521F9M3_9BACL|nr:site-specific integrase [Melghirimyces algeriensis]SMO92909.1 Phage integrase family protein [Melghirimyces algeriensis]
MNTVQPIRDKKQIAKMKRVLKPRDRFLFVLGINSGLRISDVLKLTVGDIRGKEFIEVREQKTGKVKRFRINNTIKREFNRYISNEPDAAPLFPSRKGGNSITRFTAFRALQSAAEKVGIDDAIGCHSLRKTFGYHAYKAGTDLALLQKIFNHSSQGHTLRYIGIQQDKIDEVYANIEL